MALPIALPVALAAFGAIRYGVGFAALKAEDTLERPAYSVVETLDNGVELRAYDAHTVATTTIKEPLHMEVARAQGFKDVLDYFHGANTVKTWWGKKVSENMTLEMTTPVETTVMSFDSHGFSTPRAVSVAFSMGGDFKKKHYPVPKNANIRLKRVPGHFVAVKRFHGPMPSQEKVKKEREQILKVIKKYTLRKLTARPETLVFGYHDPILIPAFLRKNEVGVIVDDEQELIKEVMSNPYL